MYKICHSAQAVRRQREMEQTLLQLMLQRRYEDITVSDLCDTLQVPRRAFYRYFSGKDGALYALIDHTLAGFFETPIESIQHKGMALEELTQTFCFWKNNRRLLDALSRSNISGILLERASAFALREGYMPQRFKLYEPQVQELALSFSVCGLMSMILVWHKQDFLLSPQEVSRLAGSLLQNPLIP